MESINNVKVIAEIGCNHMNNIDLSQDMSRRATRCWPRRLVEVCRRHAFAVSLLVFVVWLSPWLILGEHSCFTVWDSLDSIVPLYVALARSGAMFHLDGNVEQLMNGMPLVGFPSALNIMSLLFFALEPFQAYLINFLLVHFVAFVGMYMLLRAYCPSNGAVINSGISLGFGVLPHLSAYGLSVAGQPFVLLALLNILNRRSRRFDYAILCIFPFYSSLALVGVFILVCALAMFAIDFVTRKKPNWQFAAAILAMGALYFVATYQLLYSLFVADSYVSHRTAWSFSYAAESLGTCLRTTISNFITGHRHVPSLHEPILLVAVPLVVIAALRTRSRRALGAVLLLCGICLTFSFMLGFNNYEKLVPLKEMAPFLGSFNNRFHWLHPPLWYFLLALSSVYICGLNLGAHGSGRRIAGLLVLVQVCYVCVCNTEFTDTATVMMNRALGKPDRRMSYSKFYSTPLFQQIERAIGKPKHTYRVVSIGLHPGIAIYNGFYTLDFYVGTYSLVWKRAFRELIAAELAKNEYWRNYYDGWGSRCYVFCDEITDGTFMKTTKYDRPQIRHLQFNTEAFKRMGGVYILSAAEIFNYRENALEFKGLFEDDNSPWRVFLYRAE